MIDEYSEKQPVEIQEGSICGQYVQTGKNAFMTAVGDHYGRKDKNRQNDQMTGAYAFIDSVQQE